MFGHAWTVKCIYCKCIVLGTVAIFQPFRLEILMSNEENVTVESLLLRIGFLLLLAVVGG